MSRWSLCLINVLDVSTSMILVVLPLVATKSGIRPRIVFGRLYPGTAARTLRFPDAKIGHVRGPSCLLALFSHWRGRRFSNPSPRRGSIWSTSQPSGEPRFPYSSWTIHAPQTSCRTIRGSYPRIWVPFSHTASTFSGAKLMEQLLVGRKSGRGDHSSSCFCISANVSLASSIPFLASTLRSSLCEAFTPFCPPKSASWEVLGDQSKPFRGSIYFRRFFSFGSTPRSLHQAYVSLANLLSA